VIAVYAGSFDPPTLGHVDVIRQAWVLFGDVRVLVAQNPLKPKRMMPAEVAARLLERSATCQAQVAPPDRYVADYAREAWGGSVVLVRGLRDASDISPETQIRRANDLIVPGLPTVYLLASSSAAHISSTVVRGLIGVQGWWDVVKHYVPAVVLQALEEIVAKETQAELGLSS
jgi:pantetheine-phosphate adenylyltransferase